MKKSGFLKSAAMLWRPTTGNHGRIQTPPAWVLAAPFIIILALSGTSCKTPPVVSKADAEIARNTSVARSAYAAGALPKAAQHYQKALERARIIDSSVEIIHNAYNLAACLAALHSYDAAKVYLDEARLEIERTDRPYPEFHLLEAKIARAQGQFQEAEKLARAALNDTPLNNALRVQWQLLLAELKCDQAQTAAAAGELGAITTKQLQDCVPEIKAAFALTQARIEMLRRNPTAAAPQYDAAAALWQTAGRYGDMAAALEQAARAYEETGNSSAAAERYYRAARSLFESGQTGQARALAGRALNLATAAKHRSLQKQAERLQDVFKP
ncbi:MAG: hypothetical protein HYV35_08890 [Lentisphaerae bacterium]|nr:hypothetical protein [Lentisphaerota bacterium]